MKIKYALYPSKPKPGPLESKQDGSVKIKVWVTYTVPGL